MVKITEQSQLTRVVVANTPDDNDSMWAIANEVFEGMTHEWATSHPRNVQKKYDLQLEVNHPSGRTPTPGVNFALYAVKPVNHGRTAEELTRVIEIYTSQSRLISVLDSKYLNDAIQLAKKYERAFGQEFTVRKNYD